ncbi:MAG: single-stranded DNA-binding protein [Bacteroidia bacterium]|nr:single-stranded DNA-binding protein [Bacteroidia bacterium]
MYAKLIAAGRLGRDAELRSVGSGQVIRFSLPQTQRGPGGEERTLWIECSYWRNPGDSTEVLRFLRKGAVVLVEGVPSVRVYTRQDNTPGVSFECRVASLRVLVYPTAEGGVSTLSSEPEVTAVEEPTPPELPGGEDLPF